MEVKKMKELENVIKGLVEKEMKKQHEQIKPTRFNIALTKGDIYTAYSTMERGKDYTGYVLKEIVNQAKIQGWEEPDY
jgi:hypothetical protein